MTLDAMLLLTLVITNVSAMEKLKETVASETHKKRKFKSSRMFKGKELNNQKV